MIRHALVLTSIALFLTTAATARATSKCSDLAASALPEPEFRSRHCSPEGATEPWARAPEKAGTDVAYALNIRQNEFVRHDIGDFPGQTLIAANSDDLLGLDFDPTATTLYALNDDTDEFGTLGLTTGVFSAIGDSDPLTGHTWTGLSVDPVSGVIYASSSGFSGPGMQESSLYTINPANGSATLVGTDPDVDVVIDIAVNCLGEIYAHEVSTNSIYTLNPNNGQATLVGPTGVNANFPQGMDFDNESGVLYAYFYEGSGNHQYGTINLNTGDFTPIVVNIPANSEFEGATQTTCDGGASPIIFFDGWESGNTSAW